MTDRQARPALRAASLGAVLLLLLSPAAARAQDAPPTTPPPAATPRAEAPDALPAIEQILPVDDEARHREALSEARLEATTAGERRARLEEQVTALNGSLLGRKSAIEALNKEIDLAGKEKRESDRKGLEARKKSEEARLRLVQRVQELRQSEAGLEEARQALGAARAAREERSIALLRARGKQRELTSVTSSSELGKRDADLRSGEKALIEGLKEVGRAEEAAARKSREVSEKRAAAYDAWRAVSGL